MAVPSAFARLVLVLGGVRRQGHVGQAQGGRERRHRDRRRGAFRLGRIFSTPVSRKRRQSLAATASTTVKVLSLISEVSAFHDENNVERWTKMVMDAIAGRDTMLFVLYRALVVVSRNLSVGSFLVHPPSSWQEYLGKQQCLLWQHLINKELWFWVRIGLYGWCFSR